ncbi:MAG: DNA cytosine methyltransferase, partial [bacterium]|nr:DNA cytosine methyltransferase [bacterium]
MILKVGTVFSGIGAPEQALKELNINHSVKWACDIDKFAKQTYLANHSCEKWYDNVTKINISELSPVDLFCYGFPCLDISCAGKQDLTKGRSILVNYCLDITDKLQPKYFVFENVKALLSNKFKDFFNFIISRLSVNYNI